MLKTRIFVFLSALVGVLAACNTVEPQGVQVTGAWARPGLAGGNGAVFFVIDNPGAEDALLSAVSDAAAVVELHQTSMEADVMRMEHQRRVPVPAGRTEFKPGGLHVMLIGLHQDLKAGDSFLVTLHFEVAGEQTVTVVVKE